MKNQYKCVALGLLFVAFFLHQGTRQIFGATLSQIQNFFGVNRTEIGVVGSVFQLAYGLTLPFAGLAADLLGRKAMVVFGVALFCGGILLGGFASCVGFLALAYGLMNGVGQASYYPATMSLVGQLHAESRATAFSIMQCGLYAGILICSVSAGWVAGLSPEAWRTPFWVFGGVGLAWAVVLLFFLKNTKPIGKDGRRETHDAGGEEPRRPSFREAFGAIVSKPSMWLLTLALGTMIYVDVGFKIWTPTFLRDVFPGLTPGAAALHAVLWHYLGAFCGITFAARVTDRFAAVRRGIRMEINLIGLACAVPFIVLMAQAGSLPLCCLGMGLFGFFRGVYDSNILAALFDVVNPRYHATASSFMLAVAATLGSAAPTVLGWIGDHASLRSGFTSLAAFYLAGAIFIAVARVFFLRRDIVICAVVAAVVLAANVGLAKDPADWRPTERWRGFNLLGMFREPGDTSDHRAIGYFTEDEFQWIHDWGFNFVRLPMDYRHWIVDGDWNTFDEKVFERLDKVIEWGTKYGIHVQFCFHRAPGYSILSWEKQDKLQLKNSDVPLQAFAKQWAAFARHYRDVPNERLSFNLFNEPSGFTPERYDHVARTLISAIRREDPKRFIISDGIRMASTPIPSLYSVPGVGQAMRGYAPTVISHHRVFYSQGSSFRPVWPITRESPKCFCLVGPKEKGHAAFEIVGAPAGEWKFHPGRTFGRVTLRVTADGETLGEKTYEPKMDDEEHWMSPKKVGGTVEASAFDAFAVTLRRPAKRLAISAVDGGRIRIGSLEVTAPDGRHAELATDTTSGEPLKPDGNANFVQRFDGWTAEPQFRAADSFGPLAHRRATFGMDYLEDISFGRWSAAAEESGIYLMVGEFGCRATAPHDTMLRMTEDQLRLWKELGWGWALWNLRGYCGVLDTGRTDVPMEDFHGHKLDRALLELLRKW